MFDLIKSAIEGRETLKFNYPPGERYIEPHAFGYSSDGKLLLRAYQTSGASASGEHEHWKLFRMDRTNGAEPDGKFDLPRPEYSRNDRAMKGGIIAQL